MPRNVYPNAFVICPSENLVNNNLELQNMVVNWQSYILQKTLS